MTCVRWVPGPKEKRRFEVLNLSRNTKLQIAAKPPVLCCHLVSTDEELSWLAVAVPTFAKSLWRLLLLLFRHRLLLQHCFRLQRSTQVAVVHCSAQTSPSHVLQKLGQMCMVISSNTGRVYRPKDCDRLILYLKDLNLPKPDKWGTSQLIAFLHQVLYWLARLFSCLCTIVLIGSVTGRVCLSVHLSVHLSVLVWALTLTWKQKT